MLARYSFVLPVCIALLNVPALAQTGCVDASDVSMAPVSTSLSAGVTANPGLPSVVEAWRKTQLSGAESTDSRGLPLRYHWALMERPGGSSALLEDEDSVTPSFTPDLLGRYVTRLTVEDSAGASDSGTVILDTGAAPPVANAGPNQKVATGAIVQLDGSASTDTSQTLLTYKWKLSTVPNGSMAALSNPASVRPIFTADLPGTYVAQLTVFDNTNSSSPAQVTISTAKIPPTAQAGPDQHVSVGAKVQLTGSASTDPNGLALSYAWSLLTVPTCSNAALTGDTTATPSFTADVAGNYVAQLIVSDSAYASAPATVLISTGDLPPVANAGSTSWVTVGSTVTLDGTKSIDPQGLPLSYSWSFVDIPATSEGILNKSTSANATFTADQPGIYIAELIVTDSNESSTPETVVVYAIYAPAVTVRPASSTITTTQALSVTTEVSGGTGDPTPTGSVTLSSGSYTSAAATLSSGSAIIDIPAGSLAAGADTLMASYAPDSASSSTYNSATGSAPVTVNKASQTITFTQPTSPVVDGVAPITLSATGGASGNPVTFSLVSGPGTLSGTNNDLLTVTGTGTIVVAANQAGNTDYTAASQVTRSIVVDQLAVLTSPTPGSTLTGSTATFTWTAGSGVTNYEFQLGTTGVGSSDLYNPSGAFTTTLTTGLVSNIPTTGQTLYARLYSYINGAWQHSDYTYTESNAGARAVLTSPAPGSTLTGSSATFTWTAGTNVTNYQFRLGTTGPGTTDVYNAAKASTTALTTGLISNIPTTGATLYARIYSSIGGVWQYNDYTYTESNVAPAVLTSPTPGSTLTGSTATFTWTAGTGVTNYEFQVGTTGVGSSDLYNPSGAFTTTLTTGLISNIPTTGATLYARLYSYIGGAWQHTDYTYTESNAGARAVLTSPAPGSTLTGSSATFTWTAGTNATNYQFRLGTTGPGTTDVYNASKASTTALTTGVITGIPTTGATLYARIYSYIGGAWQYNDYTYTEASVAPAVLTSPAPSSTLTGSTATFTWTAGTGVTNYEFQVGTTGAGSSDLYNPSGAFTTTLTTGPISNIPTTGATLYARLYSYINGAWQHTDYTYTESNAGARATLTSPTPGSTLTGSSATFTWTAGTNVTMYQFRLGTTGPGTTDVYNAAKANTTTLTTGVITGIPTSGATLYARIYSNIGGAWQYNDYTYKEANGVPGVLTSPTPGSTLTGSSATFTWTAGTNATMYQFRLGTTGPGTTDVYNASKASTTALTTGLISNIPTTGATLYARLYSYIGGAWQYIDYTYTEANGAQAVLTSPAPGSTLTGSSATFTWTAGTNVTMYQFRLGTTGPGTTDVYNAAKASTTALTTGVITGIPTTGATLYARLYSYIDGAWQYTDYTYTEF